MHGTLTIHGFMGRPYTQAMFHKHHYLWKRRVGVWEGNQIFNNPPTLFMQRNIYKMYTTWFINLCCKCNDIFFFQIFNWDVIHLQPQKHLQQVPA